LFSLPGKAMINFAFTTINALKQIAKLIISITITSFGFLLFKKTWGNDLDADNGKIHP
jgi:hypothetical protein